MKTRLPNRTWAYSYFSGLCCPDRAYRSDTVYAIVRAGQTSRYVFTDGRTLTVGHKTRYATFPRKDCPGNAVDEGMAELREKHPLTRNLHVSINRDAFPVVSELTLKS
jgi:hypothetical protein